MDRKPDLPSPRRPPAAQSPAGRDRPRASPDREILLVGSAAVFHVNHSILYNTVFTPEIIETLASGKTPAEFRQALRERGITHVYVDWKEIRRYREPGNYGFTDFVTPQRFAVWVKAGVLDRPLAVGQEQELYAVNRLAIPQAS